MDALQFAEIKGLLNTIIKQTGPKAATGLPAGKPAVARKPWEVTLEEKGWTKEEFAKQIKQREPGWPESLVTVEGCWSAENAGKAVADMIAGFKADNPDLFKK